MGVTVSDASSGTSTTTEPMAGVTFDILFGVVLYLMSVWGCGRVFRICTLPAILGELLAGIVLGPELLDVVPFASDGTCVRLIDDASSSGSSGSSSESGRMLADVEVCPSLIPNPNPSLSPSPNPSPSRARARARARTRRARPTTGASAAGRSCRGARAS